MEGLKGTVRIPGYLFLFHTVKSLAQPFPQENCLFIFRSNHTGQWDTRYIGRGRGTLWKTGAWLQINWQLDKYPRLETGGLEKINPLKEINRQ